MGSPVPNDHIDHKDIQNPTHSPEHAEMLHAAVRDWQEGGNPAQSHSEAAPHSDAAHILGKFSIYDKSADGAAAADGQPSAKVHGDDAKPEAGDKEGAKSTSGDTIAHLAKSEGQGADAPNKLEPTGKDKDTHGGKEELNKPGEAQGAGAGAAHGEAPGQGSSGPGEFETKEIKQTNEPDNNPRKDFGQIVGHNSAVAMDNNGGAWESANNPVASDRDFHAEGQAVRIGNANDGDNPPSASSNSADGSDKWHATGAPKIVYDPTGRQFQSQ